MAKNKKKLKLVLPSKKYILTFKKGLDNARPENSPQFRTQLENFTEIKDFPHYLNYVNKYRKGKNIGKGRVPMTTYWAMVGNKFVGILKLRHKLWKEKIASHIGYAVIPSERGKGYATEMLRLGLRKAKTLGIKNVVVGCDIENTASLKVIKKNGGVLKKKIKTAAVSGEALMFQISTK